MKSKPFSHLAGIPKFRDVSGLDSRRDPCDPTARSRRTVRSMAGRVGVGLVKLAMRWSAVALIAMAAWQCFTFHARATEFRGHIDSSATVTFGGPPWCYYTITLQDVNMDVGVGGSILGGTVTCQAIELPVDNCTTIYFPPNLHTYYATGGTVTGDQIDLTFVRDAANLPACSVVFTGTRQLDGSISGALTWHRIDQLSPLDWTVTPTITLQPSASTSPTIQPISDQSVNEDGSVTVPVVIGDVESLAGTLKLAANSSDQTLISDSRLSLGGTGANRTLTVLPNPNAYGTAFITVTVTDLAGMAASTTFQLTVNPVNDAPTLGTIASQTISVNGTTGDLPFIVGDLETSPGSLIVSASSSNAALVPNNSANIQIGGSGANRMIRITPAPDQEGVATITCTVTDTGDPGTGGNVKSTTRTFTLTVTNREVLFTDSFTVSASSVDKNFEYNAGRQGGTVSPVPYTDQNPPAGVIQINNPDSPGTLRIQGGNRVSPNHSFTEAGHFSIEFDLNVDINGLPDGAVWAGVTFGSTVPTDAIQSSGGGFGIVFRRQGQWEAYDGNTLTYAGRDGFPSGLPPGPFHLRFDVVTDGFQGSPATISLTVNGTPARIGSNGIGFEYVKATGFYGNYITFHGDDAQVSHAHTYDNLVVTAYPCIHASQREPVLAVGNNSNALAVRIRPWMNQAQPLSVTLTSSDAGVAVPTGGSGGSITLNFPAGGATEQLVGVTGIAAGSAQFSLSTPSGICVGAPLPVTIYPDGSPVGFVRREVFTGITTGNTVSDLVNSPKFPGQPDQITTPTLLEAPSQIGDNYGQRIRGYLLPPVSGDYVFYISSDDNSELYLSTDEDPNHRRLIASEPNWNGERQWTAAANQISRGNPPANISLPIQLQAGQRYFFEILHSEGGGGDNVAVTWQKPGDPVPANGSSPIPGQYLAYYTPAPAVAVSFADANLEQAVRNALNIPAGSIYPDQMLKLRTLTAPNANIQNLSGMEFGFRLQVLSLNLNHISDLTPLTRLAGLQTLHLGGNQINSILPLQNLVKLQALDFRSNQISDLTPLSGLHSLRYLVIEDNQITSLTSLAGATELESLWAYHNRISDISALAGKTLLVNLNLTDNQVSNIGVLAGLGNFHFLGIADNPIADLQPLTQIASIQELQAWRVPAGSFAPVGSIAGLQALYIDDNHLSDVSFLTGLTGLQKLGLGWTQIADIAPVSGMASLKELNLMSTRVSDLRPLQHCAQLQKLWADNARISDVSALSPLSALNLVQLPYNYLDLTPGAPAQVSLQSLRNRGVTVTDTPQNPLPAQLNTLSDQGTFGNTVLSQFMFTAGDPSRAANITSITGTSSNQSVVTDAGIHIYGFGPLRMMDVTAAPGAVGETTLTITINYSSGTPLTASHSFKVTVLPSGPGNLFIEAEDFNFGGGQHWDEADSAQYLGGAYAGHGAVHGVDYFLTNGGDVPASDNYRSGENPNAGIGGSGDRDRGSFEVTTDFKVGWNDDGEWYNYTRNFSGPVYNVYARLSSGGVDMHAQLDEVTSGAATPTQTTAKLGTFDAPATGGWDTFTFVPLKTAAGNLARVHLSGERTVRWTKLPGNADINYLAFIPADTDPDITAQPQNTIVLLGSSATFSVSATGTGTLTYQWRKDGNPLLGQNGSSLTIANVQASDLGSYTVVVSGDGGSLESEPFTISLPLVSVQAPDALAAELGGNDGYFTLSRTGPTTSPLKVNFTIDGSATMGMDYNTINPTITFAAGQSEVVVPVKPIDDTVLEGMETVILTITTSSDHVIGQSTATVSIIDDEDTSGRLLREFYSGIPGGSLSLLRASPKFPSSPDVVDFVTQLESANLGDNYGVRLSGLITPPADGDYIFYIAGDDNSELWLSTDASPSNKTLIAAEPQWNGFREWTSGSNQASRGNPPANISTTIHLTASQSYYIEVLQKEGGGGDQVSVTWSKVGDLVPANGSAPIGGEHLSLWLPVALAALDPAAVQSGGPDFTLTLHGNGFITDASVVWRMNGVDTTLTPTSLSLRQIQVTIPAALIASSTEIKTALVTVQNPGGEISNPLSFTIGSAAVVEVESTVVPPGETAVVSTAPDASSTVQAGVTATFESSGTGTEPVTVTAATYDTNPEAGTLFDVGGGFVDLQVVGAAPEDSMTASFFYPPTITGQIETDLVLLYFNGAEWAPVLSSGGAAPIKDITDNIDGSVSGGRFTVKFDNTSTPKITELSGTIFAPTTPAVADDNTPPVPNLASLPTLTGQCSVTVNVKPTATDAVTGLITGTTIDALTYTSPGTYTVHWSYNDGNGNVSHQDQTVIVKDTTAPQINASTVVNVPCGVELLVPVAFTVTASDNCDAAPLISCSPASGSLFPVGATVVTCTAKDATGNIATTQFNVIRTPLGFTGFLPPIIGADATGGTFDDPHNTFKLGSTIPVKFTASCGGAAVLTGVHTLELKKYSSQTDSDPAILVTATDAATSGNQFRFAGSEWRFNLDTKARALTIGKYLLTATLSDGSTHTVWIQLK
jgi:internalin A